MAQRQQLRGVQTRHVGIPLFLDHLIATLKTGMPGQPSGHRETSKSAALHGRELSLRGFTVDEVVHDYGDLCQAITGLAIEMDAPISTEEFRTLNRCLDNGIAGSVVEYTHRREVHIAEREVQALNERLGMLAHELRNSLNTAMRECDFTVEVEGSDLAVNADRDMLLSALGNLLHNAFKFTHPHSTVTLRVHAQGDRILMDVSDQCGGLPPGDPKDLFAPYTQAGSDKAGMGLGLAICRRSVEANGGTLGVRNLPGTGCVFTIDLPRDGMFTPAAEVAVDRPSRPATT